MLCVGSGAYVEGTLAVLPGETLTIIVGCGGQSKLTGGAGFGGGGTGAVNSGGGGKQMDKFYIIYQINFVL